jgi:hypothetical protein
VIRETKELLPSDKFGLVFWTHSMGWYPATYIPEASVCYVGIDETPADEGSSMSVMEIDEIANTLPDYLHGKSIENWKFINLSYLCFEV